MSVRVRKKTSSRVVDERVDTIANIMRRAAWERGRTNRVLAERWGVSVGAVDDYAAEASRRVRAEVTDPDAVTETVAAALGTILREAIADRDRKHAISAADTWSRIVGARAPERRQEVLPTDAEVDALVEKIKLLSGAKK